MENAHLPRLIGEGNIFVRMHDAVEHCLALQHDAAAAAAGGSEAERDPATVVTLP